MTTDGSRERATAVDRAAGYAWREGDTGRALALIAEARLLDPDRETLWAEREARITKAQPGRQPANDLERQLSAAGIPPDAPELGFWRTWNASCYQRRDTQTEAGQ